ncbi:MAG: TIR domain-containing protein, partial [Streptomyces sp.]|nr:TIR domain-containing protein [Streptomyces sp.]NUS26018.1 TIR domain-containing protein [Streptomyces sp.]
IARNLEDARLFTESRDAYVDAAVRTGRRGGNYEFDFFVSGTTKTERETRRLVELLSAEGLSSFGTFTGAEVGSRENLRATIDTCRHLVLLARDSVESWHRDELNYFLRQTLDEQSDRTVFPVVGSQRVLRDLPALVQSLPSYGLAEDQLVDVAGAIAARVRSDAPHVRFDAPAPPERGHVFIGHALEDRAWAEWVAWNLREAGYEVDEEWPGRAGDSFVTTLLALPDQYRIVHLLGEGGLSNSELPVLLEVPEKFVPVRIEEIELSSALQRHGVTDLFGVTEQEAREALLRAVANPGAAPTTPPAFPAAGEAGRRAPTNQPSVWNLPARNAGFVGRDDLVLEIDTCLADAYTAVPVALTGPCGVGKTRLAIEYAHRFSGAYDVVWYIQGAEPSHLADLAVAIGCAQPGGPYGDAVRALHQELRGRSKWLLIFDGIEDPTELIALLPSGNGRVLITSRNPYWRQVATTLDVPVLSRADAVTLLTLRGRDLTKRDAAQLAEALDRLPLALVQAAEALYVFPPDQYLELLEQRASDTLRDGGPPDYHGSSLTTQLAMSLSRLFESPEAVLLVQACALLAPAPLPLNPHALEVSPHVFRQLLMLVEQVGLARVSGGSMQMPRLTQAVLRDELTDEERTTAAHRASVLLAAIAPTDDAVGARQRWRDLVPHVLTIAPSDLVTSAARYAALMTCRFQLETGDFDQALSKLHDLHRTWKRELGDDAEETLAAAAYLAQAYADTGAHENALHLDQDIFDRQRRLLGPDHPATLRTAGNLVTDLDALGRTEPANALHTNILASQRALLGEDHPDTQHTINHRTRRRPPQGAPEPPQS